MNIVIFNIGDRLQSFVSQVELIADITILFAFTKNDVKKLIQEYKPEIIFTKKSTNYDYLEKVVDVNVYYLDEIEDKTALNQIKLQQKNKRSVL